MKKNIIKKLDVHLKLKFIIKHINLYFVFGRYKLKAVKKRLLISLLCLITYFSMIYLYRYYYLKFR